MAVHFQSMSSRQGRLYETQVRQVLELQGWTIDNAKPVKINVGEIDIVATDPDGKLWWIECKGSYNNEPGLLRLDTTLKAVATAWAIKEFHPDRPPYAVWTTNRPKRGSKGHVILSRAIEAGLIDEVTEYGGFTPR